MSTCPKCGGPMNFVDQYKQWYCYKCQQYGQPIQPAGPQPAQGHQQQPTHQQAYQQPPAHSQAYPQQQYQQPAHQQPAYQQYPAQVQPAQQYAPRALSYKYTKITMDGHHTMEKADRAPDIAKMFESDPTLATVVVTKNLK